MSERGTTTDSGWSPDAALHPWLLVQDPTDSVLFGYALWHPGTGGLAWTLSTPVDHLDERLGRAVTSSGRRYELGQRIEPPDLPTAEARIAYAVLVGPVIGADLTFLLGGLDPGLAAEWVGACKIARHLGIDPPCRSARAVNEFLRQHANPYTTLMRRKLGK